MIFVGDIGINHNGDINIAKEIIIKAKECGVDVVKFQKRNPDVCVPENQKHVVKNTIFGEMEYIKYKHLIEFGKEEYDQIDALCKEIGIKWSASVWDIDSLEFITQYDIPFIKIPSACITNVELLTKVKSYGLPVIIGTGMSTFEEINNAVELLNDVELSILHCNSSYPTKLEESDLNMIKTLGKLYPFNAIGYSGHEDGYLQTIIAKSLGSKIIERHITLDRNMQGTDQKSSLDIDDLNKLIPILNNIEIALGNDYKKVYASEEIVKSKLRY